MPIRLNVFLMLRLFFLPCFQLHLGELVGISQASTPGAGWPAYAETHMNQWLPPQSTRTDAIVHTFGSDFASSEQGTEHGEADGDGLLHDEFDEHSGLKSPVSPSRAPIIFSSLGASFVLLVVTGLLIAGGKKLSALKAVHRSKEAERIAVEPKEKQPDGKPLKGGSVDARTEEIRKRLEEISATTPAAERLASAIGSDDSAVLLNKFKKALKDANGIKLKTRNSKTLENACLNVLEALKRLHQAALGQIEILSADGDFSGFSALEELDVTGSALLSKLEQIQEHPVIPSLVKTYRSVHDEAEKLIARFNEEARQALPRRQFKDEKDVAVLLDTADSLKSLQEARKARSRACEAAGKMKDNVVSSVKWFYLGKLNSVVLALEENLTGLQLYSCLVENDEGKSDDEGATRSLEVQEAQVQLNTQLEQAKLLLNELRLHAESTRSSTTLNTIFAAATKAADVESKAYALLRDCWTTAGSLPRPREKLDSRGKELVANIARGCYHTLVMESASLPDIVKEVQGMIEELWQGKPAGNMEFLNSDLVDSNYNTARNLLLGSAKRLNDAHYLLKLTRQTSESPDAADAILKLSASFSALEKDKATAELLKLSSRLLVFLEKDMERTASELHRVGAKGFHSALPFRKRYEELQTKFRVARKAAKKATTLLEAATAAAEMRTHALAMQDLLAVSVEANASWV